MTKEEYIKRLIASSGHTAKSFAQSINLPYSTLLSMLNRGLDGASVHNVIRICKALSITVEDLQRVEDTDEIPIPFYINKHEKKVISQYRAKPEMQTAIDTLLGISNENESNPN